MKTHPMNRFYIIDDHDRPEGMMIAERREDGFYYIHPKLKNVKAHHAMQPTRPTPVEDFGIEITISDGMISGKQVRDSVATYRDGKPRKWQGYPEFKFQYKGKP